MQMASDMHNPAFVSTGRLPAPDEVQRALHEAYELYKLNSTGALSTVYPALTRTPSDLFGICLVGVNGRVHEIGATGHPFTIMSISKPFLFALVCQHIGHQAALEQIGANSTGLPFNSLAAVERSTDGRTNPMVNAGAIVTTSLAPGASDDEKWAFIQSGLERFAGRRLALNEEVYASASATNFRNRSMASLLHSLSRLQDPLGAVDLYTRQCSLDITARDLAVMGATLADGGVNPITREKVVEPAVCHYTLAVMATAGLYETSGDRPYNVGLPGKSGIGGGIVTVSPGKGGLGTYAPLLDGAGNSIKGQLVAQHLSQRLGLDLFISNPEG